MPFVAFAILCSVLVSVLLKLAPRLRVDVPRAVAWNYVATSALTLLVLRPALAPLAHRAAPWPALVALGFLLPTIFLALGASVRHAGVARSDVAQRLSLLLSLAAAFVLFGEALTARKGAGLALGLVALPLIVRRGDGGRRDDASSWAFPLFVFLGFGAIDILFKRVAATGLAIGTALAVVFGLALLVSAGFEVVRRARGGPRGTMRDAGAGLVLGVVNFCNIFFYLRAHRALPRDPALVFAGMNLGVVALGALVGVIVFRERLNRFNVTGLALAVVAIGVLAGA